MFIVNLKYIVSLDEVLVIRPKHILFLEEFYGKQKFLFSGRKYSQDGGIIVVNLKNESDVHNIMQNDPFVINGIAEYELIGFNPVAKSNLITFDLF